MNYKEITNNILDILYNDKNYFNTIKTLIEENDLDIHKVMRCKAECIFNYSIPMRNILNGRMDRFTSEYNNYIKYKKSFNILKSFDFSRSVSEEDLSKFTKYGYNTVNKHAREYIVKYLPNKEKREYQDKILSSNNKYLKKAYLLDPNFTGYKEAYDLIMSNDRKKIKDFQEKYGLSDNVFENWVYTYHVQNNSINDYFKNREQRYKFVQSQVEDAKKNHQEFLIKKYREHFFVCVSLKFDMEKISVEANKVGVVSNTLLVHAKKYYELYADATEKLLYDEAREYRNLQQDKKQKELNKKLTCSNKFHGIYTDILNLSEEEGVNYIINLVNTGSLKSVSYIRTNLLSHRLSNLISEEQLEYLDKVIKKSSYILNRKGIDTRRKEHINNKNISGRIKAKESLVKVNNILANTTIIDNNLIFKDCDAELKKHLACIKEFLPESYNYINNEVDNIKKLNLTLLKNKVRKVVESICCNFDGTRNKLSNYTLLDYYLETDISLDLFYKLIPDVSNAFEQTKARKFVGLYSKQEPINEGLVYAEKIYYQYDNKELEVTNEEKTKIINYLKTNNVPVTTSTYNIALHRYMKRMLLLDDKKLVK